MIRESGRCSWGCEDVGLRLSRNVFLTTGVLNGLPVDQRLRLVNPVEQYYV
jgi:hypothetical protein